MPVYNENSPFHIHLTLKTENDIDIESGVDASLSHNYRDINRVSFLNVRYIELKKKNQNKLQKVYSLIMSIFKRRKVIG